MGSAAMQSPPADRIYPAAIKRVLAECVFVCHGILAIGWWWLMPGGFSIGNIRFWANGVWPFAVLGVSLAGLWSVARGRPGWSKACLLSLGIMALSAAVTSVLIFPDIRRIVVSAASLIGLTELALASLIAGSWPSGRALAGLAVWATILGCFMPLAQRAERASTNPLDEACPWEELTSAGKLVDGSLQPVGTSGRVTVLPSSNSVVMQIGRVRLEIEPLLTFESTSRSGGWSILSWQGAERSPSDGRLTRMASRPQEGEGNSLLFGGAQDWLSVDGQNPIEVTAFSKIPAPIYSHLNSFCILTIVGHTDLRLEFSPCGSMQFEPLPADYPVGRPARFAYCGADREFRVVEANSGEKGPFVALGEGRLESNARLSVGIVDGGRRIADVHLDDWAAQLSTAVSPTAGWGVPVNAIEFQRLGNEKQSAVMIWITLAATSVGRGWDTMGHSAGIYRNRIAVEVADE